MSDELEPVLMAGTRPEYIQSGMIVANERTGETLQVACIEGFRPPNAVCRNRKGRTNTIPCSELKKSYVLAEDFDPNEEDEGLDNW